MIKVNKFFIPYIVLLIVIGFNGEFAISFIVVLMHEGIHYLTAVLFGFSGFDVKILPIGAVLKLNDLDEATPVEDMIISLAGPIFNLIFALLIWFIYVGEHNSYLIFFMKSNFALGLFNIIPAFPLDGGRVLRDLLSMKHIYRRANELTIKVSIILGFVLLGFSIFLCFYHVINYNIAIIGIFIVVSSMRERKRVAYIIMGDIVKKKIKFLKKGYIENKSISILINGDLISVLSLVDKNKYNVFTVLDEEMRVVDIIYEEEILDALKEHGNIDIEEFVKIRENSV
jgi:Zn-dependent proteases